MNFRTHNKKEELSRRSLQLFKFIGNATALGGLSSIEEEVWNSGVESVITALRKKKEEIALNILSNPDSDPKEVERAKIFFSPTSNEEQKEERKANQQTFIYCSVATT